MIHIMGDKHGDFNSLNIYKLSAIGKLVRSGVNGEPKVWTFAHEGDYIIICGDFGGVWYRDKSQERTLDWLASLPFTILFADGNHENFNMLYEYPEVEWHGGRVHVIRDNVMHLMRGEIFDIEGKSFFVMGGASCHDIQNGVLDREAKDFEEKYYRLRRQGKFFRIKNLSWWEQELPTNEEIDRAWKNLCAHDKKVDYIITHCAPTKIQDKIIELINNNTYKPDRLTNFHQRVYDECEFKGWYCGHYHNDMKVERVNVVYTFTKKI